MNVHISTFALLAATSFSASAFSVDFTDLLGQTIQNPTTANGNPDRFDLNVPGYGSVTILANLGETLTVGQSFSNDTTSITALEFNDADAVTVRFNGFQAINVDFDFVGVSFGDDFDLSLVGGTDDFLVEFETTISAGSAGLREISFDAVPEPSTALLGGLSLLSLLRRRR